MMNEVSFVDHLRALSAAILGLLKSPETLAGSLLEAFLEWKNSRSWRLVMIGIPFLLATTIFLGTVVFAAFRSTSSVVLSCLTQADKRISLSDLEQLAFDEHYIRNKIRDRPDPDLSLEQSEVELGLKRPELKADREFAESDRFRSVLVLLRRALYANPDSAQSKYRLGLISSIDLTREDPIGDADTLMRELSNEDDETNDQAHAWLATTLLGHYNHGREFDPIQLERHLQNASRWKLVEPELLRFYSEVCRQNGKIDKALQVAKQAAENRPELNLVYAKICREAGKEHELEMLRAAAAAEAAYQARRGTSAETDMHRLALAESLIMQNRRDVAIEVLKERIQDTSDPHIRVRRGLADLYIVLFMEQNQDILKNYPRRIPLAGSADKGEDDKKNKSKEKEEEPLREVNWTFLLEAAQLEKENPFVGYTIAVTYRDFKLKLPQELSDYLVYQIKENVASSGTRLAFADLYLLNGQVTKAIQELQIVVENDPYNVNALNNLAVYLCREKPPRAELALEYIRRAYQINPNDSEICDSYGEVLMVSAMYVDAAAQLERAIRFEPKRVNSRQRLVECYKKMGMQDLATEQEKQIRLLEEEAKLAAENKKNEPPPEIIPPRLPEDKNAKQQEGKEAKLSEGKNANPQDTKNSKTAPKPNATSSDDVKNSKPSSDKNAKASTEKSAKAVDKKAKSPEPK